MLIDEIVKKIHTNDTCIVGGDLFRCVPCVETHHQLVLFNCYIVSKNNRTTKIFWIFWHT